MTKLISDLNENKERYYHFKYSGANWFSNLANGR